MAWWKVFLDRLRALRDSDAVHREIEEEVRFHIEMRTEEYVRRGMTPEEARRDAERRFGRLTRMKELGYEVRGGGMLETLRQDLRFGLRVLCKNPGFTSVAVITLALGIGANVTIFSVVNAVLLRPLPYKDSDRLVFLWSEAPKQNVRERASSYANISDWKNQSQSFEDLAVFDPTSVTLTGTDDAEQIESVRASANLLPLLGVAPIIGRAFSPEEEQNRTHVVVLSYGIWQRRFGGSPGAIGQSLEIDNVKSQVIGVMPEDFQFPAKNTQVWEPASIFPDWEAQKAQRGTASWRVVGRLKASVSLEQARAEMNTITRRLEQAYPDANQGLGVNLVPFDLQLTGRNVRLALWTLFGAVVFVLLIACTNVANLMLARAVARQREFAIRTALGAGRLRLVRQLLTESAVLSLLAGLLGLLLAWAGIKALVSFGPADIPRLDGVGIDPRVLLFTLGISLSAGILFGLAPALKVSQSDPGGELKEGRGSSGGPGARRARGLLVIAEFALAVLLLSGAGLLIRSFIHIQSVDPGFDPRRVLLVQALPSRSSTSDQWRIFYKRLVERVSALPGVERAGLIHDIFISGNPDGIITVEGRAEGLSAPARIPFKLDSISPDFFETVRVPLLRGRPFDDRDQPGGTPVAIINDAMARRFWPGEDAVGKRFKTGPAQSPGPWLTVVGVVGDMRRQGLERQPIAQIFLPFPQSPSRNMNLLVRAASDPTALAPSIRNAIRSIDKTVPIYNVSTLEGRLGEAVAQRRFQTWLLTLFSAVALLLAAVGIFGLLHQSVQLRTHEIGIRMALGARPKHILRLVISQGMSLAVRGIGLGLLAALWLTSVLSDMLFGVTATDPATFIAAPLLLAAAAFLACYFPALRATKVDPLIALRAE